MFRTYKDDKEFYDSLPRKRMGAGVLLFYKKDLMIVQPTYNPGWIIPGGTVEFEESPLEAVRREVKEETNIDVQITHLLAVDYVHNLDVKGEYLQFLFAAKELNEFDVQRIRIPPIELKDYSFVSVEKALTMLTPGLARRVENALIAQENQSCLYLEDGRAWNMAKVP